MSLGNLNIKNIIVGQRQVATAWLGPVKLWPKGTPSIILDAFQASQIDTASVFTSMNIGKVGVNVVGEILTGRAKWSETTAQISYYYNLTGEYEGQEIILQSTLLTATSSSFEQNLTDQPVTRDVTFVAIDGNTYNAQVIQGKHLNYTVTLSGITDYGYAVRNNLMPLLDLDTYSDLYSTETLPGSSDYRYAVAKVDFTNMPNFTIWINSDSSYGEYDQMDFVFVSQIDASTYPTSRGSGYSGNGYSTAVSTSQGKYSNTAKYHKYVDATATAPVESRWRKIVMPNDGGAHSIYVVGRWYYSQSSYNFNFKFIIETSGQ